jgi:Cd2+/Zn2+-exporting ATPase
MPTTAFTINQMDCAAEKQLIQSRLQRLAGITNLQFNLMERSLTVSHDFEDPQPIADAIRELGMMPTVQGRADARGTPRMQRPHTGDRRRWPPKS